MRSIGLDVHLDFCEVAIIDDGELRSAGRIETKPERIELFAGSLGPDDRVALEVTGNAWEIARIIEPHVARVLVVSPSDPGIRQARAKTDRLDARTLARLLAAESLDAVWMPDRATSVLRRRLARGGQLVRSRSRAKNQIHAVLMRQLVGRPPVNDLFGVKGRRWLADIELALEEPATGVTRPRPPASGTATKRSARPSASSRARPRSPISAPCATTTRPKRTRRARARHPGRASQGRQSGTQRGKASVPDPAL